MSSNFVRYSPEIETIDPHLDELMERIVDFWEKTVRESPEREGSGRAVRGAHTTLVATTAGKPNGDGTTRATHAAQYVNRNPQLERSASVSITVRASSSPHRA